MFRDEEPEEAAGEEWRKISCTSEIQTAFILSSFATFLGGLVILFIFRLIKRTIIKWENIKGTGIILKLVTSDSFYQPYEKKLHFRGIFRDRIEMLLSAQTFVGQVLVILVFFLSIGSLIIYFINSTDPVGRCSSYEDNTIPIDLIFNAFFSFYFGLRFLAADDKIKFWLELNSIVDIFTVPPTFISFYLKSNWLGLRFLRALRLLELPQILQILGAIKTSNSVKFSKLLSMIFSVWFTAAGFIHLVENSGDPWLKGRNSQNISYFDSFYLVMATTSTVGFGDVVAKTTLGRTFIMVFTLGSLILFANYVPEMVELFANKRKNTTSYEVVKGKKFIVVCGNITVDSVTAFLRNFLRHRSGEINTEIVFLGESPPSLELETIFKCYLAYTTFVCGSAMKWEDLRRVAVEYAEACLILANPLSSDPQAEDISNVMRVLSIKNYNPKTRVIIQILQSHNKVYLPKIPTWNWSIGDNIICFAELKLGFIAQGCLVPGLCTLLTSLFVEQNKKIFPKKSWKKHFLNGMKNKILTQRLSDDFVGMSFPEVARLCFVKMHLMLIAIEHKSFIQGGYCGLILNPPAQVRLQRNTVGFFIAESLKDVKRAFLYCSVCHSDVYTPELIAKCGCKGKVRRHVTVPVPKLVSRCPCGLSLSMAAQSSPFRLHISPSKISFFLTKSFPRPISSNSDQLDSSGMFHWCKSTPLDKIVLKRTEKSKQEFQNHIVACVFGDSHSTLLGLRNFVMPLRTSNYTRRELKDIVFIGSMDYLQREWRFLRNFPQVYIMPGSALYAGDLHAVNIEECSMCAVLCPSSKPSSSQTLIDTETIMATLNIGSVRVSCSAKPSSVSANISSYSSEPSGKSKHRRVPFLTELKNPYNIHFIEQLGGLEEAMPGTDLHLSTSFATGTVFSDSFLDSLLATAFYNYRVLELLQMLVTGGVCSQLEQHLDKEKYCNADSCTTYMSGRSRCKLGLLSLHQTILSEIEPKKNFGQLFCGSLDLYGILCIGLYRLINEEALNSEQKRFVITRPDNEFLLLPSDLVYCAIPFSLDCNQKKDADSSEMPYDTVNIEPLTPVTNADANHPSKTDIIKETTSQTVQAPLEKDGLCSSAPSAKNEPVPSHDGAITSNRHLLENKAHQLQGEHFSRGKMDPSGSQGDRNLNPVCPASPSRSGGKKAVALPEGTNTSALPSLCVEKGHLHKQLLGAAEVTGSAPSSVCRPPSCQFALSLYPGLSLPEDKCSPQQGLCSSRTLLAPGRAYLEPLLQ
ncbi:potassium channel subfamily U member 1 [Nycticebus coucang]|uniref:potassium channel subfamily U member 1 n=1 Tax=Nycticebus coucang TaxID=9470 RepID=UPI00234C9A0E|nr:potassium channel subfamily U member 1 [Nycticebus coucang]